MLEFGGGVGWTLTKGLSVIHLKLSLNGSVYGVSREIFNLDK